MRPQFIFFTFCSEEERKFLRRAAQTWAPYCVNYLGIFYAISLSHMSRVVNTVFQYVSHTANTYGCIPLDTLVIAHSGHEYIVLTTNIIPLLI